MKKKEEEREKKKKKKKKKVTSASLKMLSSFSAGLPKFNVAFTVTTPKPDLADKIPVFVTIVTNVGEAYDQKTGRFTSPVSGVYLFSVTLRSTGRNLYCWIRKNGNGVVYAQTSSSDAMLTSTALTTLELSVGDVVDIGDCYNWNNIYTNAGTAFSGVLISS